MACSNRLARWSPNAACKRGRLSSHSPAAGAQGLFARRPWPWPSSGHAWAASRPAHPRSWRPEASPAPGCSPSSLTGRRSDRRARLCGPASRKHAGARKRCREEGVAAGCGIAFILVGVWLASGSCLAALGSRPRQISLRGPLHGPFWARPWTSQNWFSDSLPSQWQWSCQPYFSSSSNFRDPYKTF